MKPRYSINIRTDHNAPMTRIDETHEKEAWDKGDAERIGWELLRRRIGWQRGHYNLSVTAEHLYGPKPEGE